MKFSQSKTTTTPATSTPHSPTLQPHRSRPITSIIIISIVVKQHQHLERPQQMLASSNHHYPPMEIVPMEPLFDEDWLHEHNLDTLFDLFEEEVERKGLNNAPAGNSSTFFGSSPVTSYLFGTSPPLASALDIYDLLYFDNNNYQQQQQQPHNSQQQTTASSTTTTLSSSSSTTSLHTTNSSSTHHLSANSQINPNIQVAPNNTKTYNVSGIANGSSSIPNVKQQAAAAGQNSYLANSITNAMRIKRRFKKGQNEGISLLAKPLSNNNDNNNDGSSSGMMINNQNNSDKSSSKITTTNSKQKPNCNDNISTRGIDIKQSHHNRNRHIHHTIHHNVHHITGFSIIREHAYAVRGH